MVSANKDGDVSDVTLGGGIMSLIQKQPFVVPGLAFGKGLKLESIVWLDPGDTADPNPIGGDVSHILPLL